MTKHALHSILVVLLVSTGMTSVVADTVTLQQGVDGYAGAKDVWLYADAETGNLGAHRIMVTRNEEGAKNSTALVSFDLSGKVPSNATIISATLKLYNYSARYDGNTTINIHRVLRDWEEGTGVSGDYSYTLGATWKFYSQSPYDVEWDSAGALGAGDSVGTATDSVSYYGSTTGSGWVSFDVTADVSGYVSESFQNYGWVLNNAFGKADQRFYTSDHTDDPSLRPVLVVEYVPEPVAGSLMLIGSAVIMNRRKRHNR